VTSKPYTVDFKIFNVAKEPIFVRANEPWRPGRDVDHRPLVLTILTLRLSQATLSLDESTGSQAEAPSAGIWILLVDDRPAVRLGMRAMPWVQATPVW
jgi:hypothetical protein